MKRNTTKKFDAKTGMRLTTCCAAHSTYMDDGIGGMDLCCKACYYEVEVGEGDGNEYKKREITKNELMQEIVDLFAQHSYQATPNLVRAYAKRMMSIYREYDLCGEEIFKQIETRYTITIFGNGS